MILSGYCKKAQYFIEMVGMASDSVGQVTIDNKFALIQLHASSAAAIVPPIGADHPTFDEVVFYMNCLAYEHDIPAFIWPARGKALIKPLEKGKRDYIRNSYYDALHTAYEAINSFKLGPLGYVYFRWPGEYKPNNLPYAIKYSGVSKELSLYSTAVRQLDPLSEFLDYYRIIESVSGNNHKNWISSNLSSIEKYCFGFLEYEVVGEERIGNRRRQNLFSIYKRRALSRLKVLSVKLSEKSIVEYFYNENRCGIAHGKTDIKTYDFGYNIQEISQDVYVLKLLSRMAIEDKL